MAQLKDTIVNGDLTVTGNIVSESIDAAVAAANGTNLGTVKGSNGDDGDVVINNGVISVKDDSHNHQVLQGVYTQEGGRQGPSYIGTHALRCNMMSGFDGPNSSTLASFSSYADVLMMNAYSWSDVPYATALAIQKTSGVPKAWIAAGGNNNYWDGATEIVTANNLNSQLGSTSEISSLKSRLDSLGFKYGDLIGKVKVSGEDKSNLTLGKIAKIGHIVYGFIWSGDEIYKYNSLSKNNVEDIYDISKDDFPPPSKELGFLWWGSQCDQHVPITIKKSDSGGLKLDAGSKNTSGIPDSSVRRSYFWYIAEGAEDFDIHE